MQKKFIPKPVDMTYWLTGAMKMIVVGSEDDCIMDDERKPNSARWWYEATSSTGFANKTNNVMNSCVKKL